ncbi:hypothetical protein HN865_01800 [Candidatus Woesearchaeota archaeon]|jgi:hypothetical protein|nr:hypothetical protein [Candidatus Woesearchaeota archaeon]MBT7237569.1 hypothetical protein [Candidatus Woesearchaeota archaeon]
MKYKLSLESYLNRLKEKTEEHKVKLILENRVYFYEDKTTIGGYFSEEPLELAVATRKKRKIWLPYLIHEDSHLDQWIEQCQEWTNTQINGTCASEIMPAWINGKEYPIETIKKAIISLKKMELDCERRALRKIKKFNLPINPQHYIKTAAINIHQYNYALIRKKYPRKNKTLPYKNIKILKTMPRTLRGNFNRLTKKQLEAFDEFTKN